MKDTGGGPGAVEEYIAGAAPEAQAQLRELRAAIRAAAPEAAERISYGMPAFDQDGVLVYYAAFKRHVGFYPTGSGVEAFREELAAFEGSKGAVRFPLGQPLPLDLVARIVRFRIGENQARAAERAARKRR